MKIKWWKLVSVGMAAAMALPLFAACKDKSGAGGELNESRVLNLSSGDFDGVFSPFFATSAYDSTIVGQTQISMIGADDEGKNVLYGPDEPVVALDYNETMYNAQGKPTATGAANGTTVYQMVIKKGIKFADGVELTAHDVLFNLYTYLDRNYTGSSTLYSTDIVGLQAYLAQDPNATDNTASSISNTFSNLASLRSAAIQYYADDPSNTSRWQQRVNTYNSSRKALYEDYDATNNTNITDHFVAYGEADIKADILSIKEEFRNELNTIYNGIDMSTYETDYTFDSDKIWQGFFYETGLIKRKSSTVGGVTIYEKEWVTGADGQPVEKFVIDWENSGISPDASYTKEEAIETVYEAFGANDRQIPDILNGWSTGSTMLTNFSAMDSEDYYGLIQEVEGGLAVPSIEGIKILDASEFDGSANYAPGEYDMLQITINGVDPKAKWNFAFSVAPMHYYSTPELTAAAMADTEYASHFGVEYSSLTFMNALKRRNSVPMGAGVYQATTRNDDVYTWEADDNWNPTSASESSFNTLKDGFLSSNVAYFIRNDNFVTTGGNEEEVFNAKIKRVQYKVLGTTQVMTALQGKSIDIADPTANKENVNLVNNSSFLDSITLSSVGYGYIGINAKFVPNINIRRAIMSVMNPLLVQNYYPNNLSQPVYRPFSKTSWVYDAFDRDNVEAWQPENYYGYDNTFATARSWLTAEHADADKQKACTYSNGTWYDEKGQPIELTFTVAGETYDHPAYQTLLNAAEILNNNGIKTTITPDARALYKLASGNLAIWAAAWSSTIDPDMYQVYHKDSRATSVLNWGYDYLIRQNNGSQQELSIINELSELIDEGRETIVQSERALIYREAADLVMELAVELPLYQRSDMYVYNDDLLDADSFYPDPSPFMGPLSEIWKISYK